MLTKTIRMFLLSFVIMALLVLVILGFMLGVTHPLPWLIISVLLVIPIIHNKLLKKGKLRWKSSMSTGIALVDDDHKKLIDLINKFQQATEYNVDTDLIKQTLNDVVSYTQYHFDREEQLMKLNNYPNFAAHKKQHQQMINKINQCAQEYVKDQSLAIDHILLFLKKWLIKHINGSDKEYVPYLIITTLPECSSGNERHV